MPRHGQAAVHGNELVLSVAFNQDATCLAVSTNRGFKIYQISHPSQDLLLVYESQDIGVVSLIEMQFRSNIVALVTRSTFAKSKRIGGGATSGPNTADSVTTPRQRSYQKGSHMGAASTPKQSLRA